ncbi:hypothetical protein BST44_00905 [Mycobacterium scrofulaceum]|uniref:Uncharacterized protein n=1 Tax=Mycobacterium scrofulaceum TaxID=1783 RepID=A0A1X0KME7_MYCSC|nr:hypothetical protein BST44_00905 [Mycobacterium scrofulaceum]
MAAIASAAKPGAAGRLPNKLQRSRARRSRARRVGCRTNCSDRERGEAGRGGSAAEQIAAIASAAKPGAAGRLPNK